MSSPFEDDESSAEPAGGGGGAASPRVLRASLVVLITSTIVLFLSAVASSNAAPNSPQEQVALAVHRLSMFAMLLGFFGILAAYRLPVVLEYLRQRSSGNAAAGASHSMLAPDLSFLVASSGLLMLWVWMTAWFGSALLHQLTVWGLLAAAGCLANVALMHGGCIRSFAVAALVTTILTMLHNSPWLQMMMFGQGQPLFGGVANYNWLHLNFAIEVTVVLIAGLASAFYFQLVARKRAQATAEIVTRSASFAVGHSALGDCKTLENTNPKRQF
jgi:hypothetical protein